MRVSASEAPATSRRRDRRGVALVAALIVAVAAAAGLGWQWQEEQQRAEDLQRSIAAGVSAEDAARDMLVEMTTYSHDSLEEDFAWMGEFITPELAEAYREEVASIRRFAKAGELELTGSVADLAHRVVEPDRVVVLAFVDQQVRSEKTGRSSATELRMRLVLTREDPDADWIVANLENLSGQNQVAAGPDAP